MNEGNDRINQLIKLTRAHAQAEGMPEQVMLGQALLLGLGVCGERLVWKRPDKKNPQIAKASVTWLGLKGEIPLWYHRYTAPVFEWEQRAQQAFKNALQTQVSNQPRKSRRLQRNLGQSITQAFIPSKSDLDCYNRKPTAFLVTSKWKAVDHPASTGVFGRDRLLLMAGSEEYSSFMESSESAVRLRSAGTNRGGGLRVAVNGWCDAMAFSKLMRQIDPAEAAVFGWVLPASRPYVIPEGEWVKAKLVGEILHESLKLRFSLPLDPYSPVPEVAELLSATDDWMAPEWCAGGIIEPLLRRDEDLAWQLAAQLANIHGQLEKASWEAMELAKMAVELAVWIRWSHACQLKRIYPGPRDGPLEPVSSRIVDQLSVGPRTVREMVRGFHSVPTGAVQQQLDRMIEEGWVSPSGKRSFKLAFPKPEQGQDKSVSKTV